MTTTLVIFGIILFLAFVIYASLYSTSVQKINDLERKLKVPGIEKNRIEKLIKEEQDWSNLLKKYGLIPFGVIFLYELYFIGQKSETEFQDFLIALIIFVGIVLFVLIVNWMKGAGTIDNTPRDHKSPWI